MRYLSLFSGIEAATVAWEPLGWECVGVSEIEDFPCKLLNHYYPDVPNLGDITKITEDDIRLLGDIDLVVFGSPCQDLSVAGKQRGLNCDITGDATRSGLFFTAIQIIHWARKHGGCRYALWENVPGAFSSKQGEDFAAVVREMGGFESSPDVPKNGWGNTGVALGEEALVEWATLDAQYFGVPQRRRRVFALADFGDWFSRPQILFERDSLQGNNPQSKGKGKETAPTLTRGFGDRGVDLDQIQGGAYEIREVTGTITTRTGISRNNHEECVAVQTIGALDTECGFQKASHQSINAGHILPIAYREADLHNYKADESIGTLKKSGGCLGGGSESIITYALAGNTIGRQPENGGNGNGYDESGVSYTLTKTDVHAVAFNAQGSSSQGDCVSEHITPTLDKSKTPAVAHAFKVRGGCEGGGKGYLGQDEQAFTLSTGADQQLFHKMQVRRLMPIECERLQGFPDNYTNIPGASDSARYKALGNSMAVPVMHWIGQKIQFTRMFS